MALSLGSRRVGVTNHRALPSSDFPPGLPPLTRRRPLREPSLARAAKPQRRVKGRPSDRPRPLHNCIIYEFRFLVVQPLPAAAQRPGYLRSAARCNLFGKGFLPALPLPKRRRRAGSEGFRHERLTDGIRADQHLGNVRAEESVQPRADVVGAGHGAVVLVDRSPEDLL